MQVATASMSASSIPVDLRDQYISSQPATIHDGDAGNPALPARPPTSSVEQEQQRYKAVAALRSCFDSTVTQWAVKVSYQTFEKWLFESLHYCSTKKRHDEDLDPLIPCVREIGEDCKSDTIVASAATEAGAHLLKAQRLLQDLFQTARQGRAMVVAARTSNRTPVSVSFTFENAVIAAQSPLTTGSSTLSDVPCKLQVSLHHFRKLQALHALHNPSSGRNFLNDLYCMLLRYRSLCGDFSQGAGFQAAIHPSCFRVMQQRWHVSAECFASPLNVYCQRYCSMFPDTDSSFGSLGSFFDFYPKTGSFQVNPPFSFEMVDATAAHIIELLEQQSNEAPLSFIVVIPQWTDCRGWKQLTTCKNKRRLVTLRQRKHHYLEGAQHQKSHNERISTCDTSVIFVQNQAAAVLWPVTDDGVEELRQAFCSSKRRKKWRAEHHTSSEHRTACARKGVLPLQVRVSGCAKASLNGTYRLSNQGHHGIVFKHDGLAWGKQHWMYCAEDEGVLRWFIGHDCTASRKVKSSTIGRGGASVGYVLCLCHDLAIILRSPLHPTFWW